MLTELKLANFRIFDDEVTVRFRPITVLIGRNSSGKSSVIKFLLMLQQSSEARTSEFMSPEGEQVHLGALSGLKNTNTAKSILEFEMTVSDLHDSLHPSIATYLELENIDMPQTNTNCV